jgi:hypothetical protein
MSKQPTFLADRLAWVFRKAGAEGAHTREFGRQSVDTQSELRRLAGIPEDESPAVASFFDATSWNVLTDRRIVWSHGEPTRSLTFGEVASVTIAAGALAHAKDKAKIQELEISSADGARFLLRLDPGPPLIGFWNAAKAAIGR